MRIALLADDASAARGPHGSNVRYILRKNFVVDDGSEKAAQAYPLCFSCHAPEKVLSSTGPFPGHPLHVQSVRASCASCHNPHGSVANRALIRFGEDTGKTVAIPSPAAGSFVNAANQAEFIAVLEKRLIDLSGSGLARVKKVIKEAQKR